MKNHVKPATYADALALVKSAKDPEMCAAVLATMDASELRHLVSKLVGLVGIARTVLVDVEGIEQWCDAIAPHLATGHDDGGDPP